MARAVMTAAAKNLTPVALELGGKCPAIVDSLSSSWDKQVVINLFGLDGVGFAFYTQKTISL